MNSVNNLSYLSALVLEPSRILTPDEGNFDVDVHDVVNRQMSAQQRIQKAENQCLSELDKIRSEAYSNGRQEGVKTALKQISSTLNNVKVFADSNQQQITQLVLGCMKKIFGELSHEVLVPAMVNNALAEYADEITTATIYVNPDMAVYLEEEKIENVRIEINPDLGITDVSIETADCIKDISLSRQMSALQRQFAVS